MKGISRLVLCCAITVSAFHLHPYMDLQHSTHTTVHTTCFGDATDWLSPFYLSHFFFLSGHLPLQEDRTVALITSSCLTAVVKSQFFCANKTDYCGKNISGQQADDNVETHRKRVSEQSTTVLNTWKYPLPMFQKSSTETFYCLAY